MITHLHCRLRFEPANAWVGIAWQRFRDWHYADEGGSYMRVTETKGWDIRIALLPCLPLAIRWPRSWQQTVTRVRS